MEERQHLLRGELFEGTETFMEERETFSRTEEETEWRDCRAQIVRDWAPTSIVGRLHFSYCLIYCFIL